MTRSRYRCDRCEAEWAGNRTGCCPRCGVGIDIGNLVRNTRKTPVVTYIRWNPLRRHWQWLSVGSTQWLNAWAWADHRDPIFRKHLRRIDIAVVLLTYENTWAMPEYEES